MKVLVACEESQRVCCAICAKGHEAYSCDIVECSGGHPEWHILGDVLNYLNPTRFMPSDEFVFKVGIPFCTQDGRYHEILGKWDLIIAHPPCTRLCNSGQRWLYYGDEIYREKKRIAQEKAIEFFMCFVNSNCDRIAIENPMGIMSSLYRKPDCTYNPYDFIGETECKKTCLWLKGLEPLKPTRAIPLPKDERTQGIWKAIFDGKQFAWNDSETARLRSQTPLGVAKAMAEQWG